MASSSRNPKTATVSMPHIVLAIGLGLAGLSALIAGGTFAGNSLSALMESTELASPEAINPLR